MTSGLSSAIAACLIWGTVFIAPLFLPNYTPSEIATGRFFCYGLISCLFLYQWKAKVTRAVYFAAIYAAFLCVFGFYMLLYCIQNTNPAIAALLLGLAPVTISLYGNYRRNEQGYRHLLAPLSIILTGLLLTNLPKLYEHTIPQNYLWGLLAGFVSLFCWTQYTVENALFLKKNREITPFQWTALCGVVGMFWAALFFFILPGQSSLVEAHSTQEILSFVIISAILGVVCSWLACFLWLRACAKLPVTLAGQLSVLETVFGLLFACLCDRELPSIMEVCGVILLLTGVLWSIKIGQDQRYALNRS